MSIYVAGAGSRYIVREEKLSRAYAFLKDRLEKPAAKPIGDGLAEVYPKGDEFFCDRYVHYGFQDDAIEFISEFCEPNSYASFRDDDNFEYGIVWKDEEGDVHEECEEMCNPFWKRMQEMDAAIEFVEMCGCEEER